jgi:hypothetical protein
MSRQRPSFRQRDLTRAVKAVIAADVGIARVEIDGAGKIIIIAATAPAAEPQGDDLDQELREWEACHGQG